MFSRGWSSQREPSLRTEKRHHLIILPTCLLLQAILQLHPTLTSFKQSPPQQPCRNVPPGISAAETGTQRSQNKGHEPGFRGSLDWGIAHRSLLTFQYVVHWSPLHCIIMRKWMLTWNLQNLFSGLYLHAIFLFGSVCVVYSDCTPEQLAAIMNCSKHERHTRNYDYMEGGDVRIRQLFSRTQWFLTIDDYGNINGTQDPTNCYSKDGCFCLIITPVIHYERLCIY